VKAAAFGLCLLAAALAAGRAAAGPRVVSINLCTDELLLALADPERIAGLSPFARQAARGLPLPSGVPILSGTAEEIVVIRPDLVVSSRFMKRETRAFLLARKVPLAEFEIPRTLEEARGQIRRMAALLGSAARGEARIAALDAAVARLQAAGAGRGLSVLPYSRRGWSQGPDSIVGDILATAGLRHADAAGFGRFRGLEAVVRLRPDALLLSGEASGAADQGQALLAHPALTALAPPERRLNLPEGLTVCGGPVLAEALGGLAAQLERLPPRR
jgi:iron complex transport system substrate-binding protein